MTGKEPDPSDSMEAGEATAILMGDRQRQRRRLWRSLPHAPRCKLCHRPLAGPGGAAMRVLGLGPWPGNPKYCRGCFRDLYRYRAGAEIECSLLFADVRESTSLAERLRPAEYRRVMDRFYTAAVDVLVAHDAFVDKFVGDEVIGIFVPALADGSHAGQAITAGLELLHATGHADEKPWVPVGIGVNSGIAYVGAVGTDEHVEFTALGDEVNVTARLASLANAGELLVTTAAASRSGLDDAELAHRRLELKGKAEPVDVVVLPVTEADAGSVLISAR